MSTSARISAGAFMALMSCSASPNPSAIDTTRTVAAPAPASAGHALVYADDLQMVLLVNAGLGGMTTPASSSATRIWGWTGAEWRLIDSVGPPVRNLAGVAYDTRRHVLVMHGGSYDLAHQYGDTWEWTRAGGWRQFSGATPGVRDHTQMAFDASRGRAVLFGGSEKPEVAFGDTWEFDGARWERVSTTGPPARIHHAMEFDPVLARVVLFGGVTPGGTDLGDTWVWDGSRWTAGASTTARTHARLVFHRRLNAMVLLGGLMRSTPDLGVLTLRNGAWTSAASAGPSARYLPAAAYDAKRDVLVLFGGGDPNGMTLFQDTWEFDGTAWLRR